MLSRLSGDVPLVEQMHDVNAVCDNMFPSASEVTTVWRYRNSIIIIIIPFSDEVVSRLRCLSSSSYWQTVYGSVLIGLELSWHVLLSCVY